MTGNVVNQWEKGRIFNKSCGPIDYIWKKITLNFFFMTYRFTFPSGLKTKKKNQEKRGRCIYSKTQVHGSRGCNKYVNNLKRENVEEISVCKPRVLFFIKSQNTSKLQRKRLIHLNTLENKFKLH